MSSPEPLHAEWKFKNFFYTNVINKKIPLKVEFEANGVSFSFEDEVAALNFQEMGEAFQVKFSNIKKHLSKLSEMERFICIENIENIGKIKKCNDISFTYRKTLGYLDRSISTRDFMRVIFDDILKDIPDKGRGIVIVYPVKVIKSSLQGRMLHNTWKYILLSLILTLISYFIYDGRDLRNKFSQK